MSTKLIKASIELNGQTHKVGRVWYHQSVARQSATFEYDPEWLGFDGKFALDPSLPLEGRTFHTKPGQALFSAIGDSTPYRWGRELMERRELARAKPSERFSTSLSELDYLLCVNDRARQGALRFSSEDDGSNQYRDREIPPLSDCSEILLAAERVQKNEESPTDLEILVAPGSSLGGARPKASFIEKGGQIVLAKFPKVSDKYRKVVWEAVALALAKKAGINVAEWRLETFSKRPVLVLRRFDRVDGQRIPFLSAMGMLGSRPFDPEERSYLDVAQAILDNGSFPSRDLEELWRRIIFMVLISNMDDHLMNHGFLHDGKGWMLSPAYDLNPIPDHRGMKTPIVPNDPTPSVNLAFSIISNFRIGKPRAIEIAWEVKSAVDGWRCVAEQLGLTSQEINDRAHAFENRGMKEILEFF